MFRHPPKGFTRYLMRAPILMYRLRLGWLLGGRFLSLEHRGRKSGKVRRVVLEVVEHERETGTYWIAASYGDGADWYLNVKAEPNVRVTVGRRRFRAAAEALSQDESKVVLDRYQKRHPAAVRGLQRVLGYESFEDLKEHVPVVELRRRGRDPRS